MANCSLRSPDTASLTSALITAAIYVVAALAAATWLFNRTDVAA
jgi:hypothetical protein